MVQTVQDTVWKCRSCSLLDKLSTPCCGAEAYPYGPFQVQYIDTVVDVLLLTLRRSSCPLGQLRFLRSVPRQAEVALRRGIFAAEMRHFSPSVLSDVEAQVAGTPGV